MGRAFFAVALAALIAGSGCASGSGSMAAQSGQRFTPPCDLITNYRFVGPEAVVPETGEIILPCEDRFGWTGFAVFSPDQGTFRLAPAVCETTEHLRADAAALGVEYGPRRAGDVAANTYVLSDNGTIFYACAGAPPAPESNGAQHHWWVATGSHRFDALQNPTLALVGLPGSLSQIAFRGVTSSGRVYHEGRHRDGGSVRFYVADTASEVSSSREVAFHRFADCPHDPPRLMCRPWRVWDITGSQDVLILYSLRFGRAADGRFPSVGTEMYPAAHEYAALRSGHHLARVRVEGDLGRQTWSKFLTSGLMGQVFDVAAGRALVTGDWGPGRNRAAQIIDLETGRTIDIPTPGRARGHVETGALSHDGRYALVRRMDNRVLIFDLTGAPTVLPHRDAVAVLRTSNVLEHLIIDSQNRIWAIRENEVIHFGTLGDPA